MRNLILQLRYSLRSLRRSPLFTAIVLTTLALAIGINTLIFSIVSGVLLSPLPFPDADRLVMLHSNNGEVQFEVSVPNYEDLRREKQIFSEVASVYSYYEANLTGEGGPPEVLHGAKLSAEALPVLGMPPMRGRGFTQEDFQEGRNNIALIGDGLWLRRFSRDPGAIGNTLLLDGEAVEVVGIMPPDFAFPNPDSEIWLPIAPSPQARSRRAFAILHPVARLVDGVSLERARSELDGVSRRLAQEYPETNTGIHFEAVPLLEREVGESRGVLWVLQGAVLFLLLIACANVGNLMLARALGRRREMALRAALGAGRWRLIRQLLLESAVLATVGLAAGLLLSELALRLLPKLGGLDLPRMDQVAIDGRVLLFSVFALLLTIALCGVAPAALASRLHLSEALRQGERGSSLASGRVRNVLVVLQLALALVLLTGTGLMVRTFLNLQDVDLGFEVKNLVTMRVTLPEAHYPDSTDQDRFVDQTLDRLRQDPRVVAAAATGTLPLTGRSGSSWLTIENRPWPPNRPFEIGWRVATRDYFQTLRIPLISGRDFASTDTTETPLVGLVNQAAVDQFWPGQDPLGVRTKVGPSPEEEPWITIVGVVGDVRDDGPASDPPPALYQYTAQRWEDQLAFVVRTHGDPTAMEKVVRDEIWSMDRDLPVVDQGTVEALLQGTIARQELALALMGALSVLALVLAIAGVYGVFSYRVRDRRREIGIRMALGADRQRTLLMILRQALWLTAVALVVGVVAAMLLTRFLGNLLFGVEPTDLVTLSAVVLVLAAVAMLACLLPAARAARIEPSSVLRME